MKRIVLNRLHQIWEYLPLHDSTLYCDQPCQQILCWSYPGGISALLQHCKVLDFPNTNKASTKSILFQSQLLCDIEEQLVTLLSSGPIEQLHILSLHPQDHPTFDTRQFIEQVCASFGIFCEPIVECTYVPLLQIPITPTLLITPGTDHILKDLSTNDLQQVTSSLYSILETLNMNDQVFAIGSLSMQVGKALVEKSTQAPRRTSQRNIAVVLIDRLLDLASPLLLGDSFLNQVYSLGRHPLDQLDIPQRSNLKATFCHGLDQRFCDALEAAINIPCQDYLVQLRKKLVYLVSQYVHKQDIPMGFVTSSQLLKLMQMLPRVKEEFLLQLVVAACIILQEQSDETSKVCNQLASLISFDQIGSAVQDSIDFINKHSMNDMAKQVIICLVSLIESDSPVIDYLLESIPKESEGWEVEFELPTDHQQAILNLKQYVKSRQSLQCFNNLFQDNQFQGLLKRVILDLTNQSMEHDDYCHIPREESNVMSGFTRLFNRSHPAQFKTVLIYMVGGISIGEVQVMRQVLNFVEERDQIDLFVGGTGIQSGNTLVNQVFY